MKQILKAAETPFHCKTTLNLMIIYAIQSICGGIAFYISLFLKSNSSLDALDIGIVISATSIGNVLGSNLGGYISDKYNPFYSLKSGLAIQGLALFCLVYVKNFYAIFFTMAFMGAGSYLYITSSNYILTTKFNTNQDNRARIISNQNIISNIGMFLAAILMGYCAEGFYTPIFTSVSLIMILISINLKAFDKSFYSNNASKNKRDKIKRAGSYHYLIGFLGIGLIGIMYSQHSIGYPLFLESSFGNINTGYLMSLNPLVILFFQNTIIKLSNKLNEIVALSLGLLFFGISFFLLNFPINLNIIMASCIMMTLGEILAITYTQSIAFGYAPFEKRGRALGVYKTIYSVTKIMGAYLAGIIINFSNYTALWVGCGALGVGGFVITIAIVINSNLRKNEKLSKAIF